MGLTYPTAPATTPTTHTLLFFPGPNPPTPDFRGVLQTSPEIDERSKLQVAVGPGIVTNGQSEDRILSNILAMETTLRRSDVKSMIFLGHADSLHLRTRLLSSLPRFITTVELHLVNDGFAGYREVYIYGYTRLNPTITLVLPAALIERDGSLPMGMLTANLNDVKSLYVMFAPSTAGILRSSLFDRTISFLTRFHSLRELRVARSLIQNEERNRVIESTFKTSHPHAEHFSKIQGATVRFAEVDTIIPF
ncbi:hypothetical protein D9613_010323 [Agrocybe pediades]|uniref:Uncharacterized protein n=1 Tax=Agrocybe pediades TaxID=84607 RepID=A0A8H4QG88_9AGAR|nr:hypothetical protein D9613_010323 [Agrocybe pediades]